MYYVVTEMVEEQTTDTKIDQTKSTAVDLSVLRNMTDADARDLARVEANRPERFESVVLWMSQDGTCHLSARHSTSGTPADEWHNQSIAIGLPGPLTPKGYRYLADTIKDDLQTIHDGHEVVWNGSNHVGRLTDEAKDALMGLRHSRDLQQIYDQDGIDLWDAGDWLDMDPDLLADALRYEDLDVPDPDDDAAVREAAKVLEDDAWHEDVVLCQTRDTVRGLAREHTEADV